MASLSATGSQKGSRYETLYKSRTKKLTWHDKLTVLVISGLDGFGLELVKGFLLHEMKPDILICAYSRDCDGAELKILKSKNKELSYLYLDIYNTSTYPKFTEELKDLLDGGGLNVVINRTCMSFESLFPNFDGLVFDEYADIFKKTLVCPLLLVKHLLPCLKKSARINPEKPEGILKAVLVNLSLKVPRTSYKHTPKHWGYKESETAMAQSTKSLSKELAGAGVMAVLILHQPSLVPQNVQNVIDVICNLNHSKNGEVITL